jgi:L-threonylcarbamoyladenylate synthase
MTSSAGGTGPRILRGDEPAAVDEAARVIRAGGIVAFPTETVYGLGANAFDPVAVARVFEAKGRPAFDPLIVHVADPAGAIEVVATSALDDPRFVRLVARFWPGPLTLVVPKSERVPGIVTAGLDTVGVRMPDHVVARALIIASGVPVAAPSANRFGRVSPTRAEHVARQLGDRVGLILDGGPCRVGVESTVVLLAGSDGPVLLRAGGVTLEELEAVLGPVAVPAEHVARSLSPGRSGSHYAPAARVVLTDPYRPARRVQGERLGLLAASEAGRRRAEDIGGPFDAVEVLAGDGDPVQAAANLFEALHRLDEAGVDRIVAQPVVEAGLGRAVMDRLRRAAATGDHGHDRR